jgi:hypothetical protein
MPTTTYRERRAARADRLDGWAAKRDAKATAAYEQASNLAARIPFGQPILIGHHSEGRARRDAVRIGAGMSKSLEHANMAASMASKAANIRSAADAAIYSDDPDAIERLNEKLAGLEAERAAIVAYNKTARKGTPDLSLLPERLRSHLERAVAGGREKLVMPAYVLSNLSGTIGATRKRIASLTEAAV